jgi:hypothetical protein
MAVSYQVLRYCSESEWFSQYCLSVLLANILSIEKNNLDAKIVDNSQIGNSNE